MTLTVPSAVGTMTVTNTVVAGNTADGNDSDQSGGGLFNDGGTLVVSGGSVDANQATGTSGSGGGLLNNLGTLEVSGTVISGNDASRAGGGIEANAGSTDLDQVELDGNSTGDNPGNGGGLHLTGAGDVTVTNSSVTNNFRPHAVVQPGPQDSLRNVCPPPAATTPSSSEPATTG